MEDNFLNYKPIDTLKAYLESGRRDKNLESLLAKMADEDLAEAIIEAEMAERKVGMKAAIANVVRKLTKDNGWRSDPLLHAVSKDCETRAEVDGDESESDSGYEGEYEED